MSYSIQEIWKEATELNKACNMSYHSEEAYMYRGIKITKVENDIKIFTTSNARYAYHEMNDSQYLMFHELGFKEGVHAVVKKQYEGKIDLINKKIKTEINTRNNKKQYDSLKLKRETLINKFSNLK